MLKNELSVNAKGGTELMQSRLYSALPASILDKFQIWFSRYRPDDLDESKYQILYCHDLVDDPETNHLANGGWKKFHKIVFVSNWQMQQYIVRYHIPFSRCHVMHNAIQPIEVGEKRTDKLKLGYWSTPHRGLTILVPVFEYLSEKYPHIELDVFSSFNIYGWSERDAPFEPLFDKCRQHPKINYHGSVDNATIRAYAKEAHILAYPSIWQETSCLVLMEAMSAQMLCVHSNLGALFETGANWTSQYQYSEDMQEHAARFHEMLETAILTYDHQTMQSRLMSQKAYADVFYNWDVRISEWEIFLTSVLEMPLTLKQQLVFDTSLRG